MTRSNGLGDDGEQLETDEDQETIRTSGRKEPRSHMDLEPDQETGYPDKNQGVTWTPPAVKKPAAQFERVKKNVTVETKSAIEQNLTRPVQRLQRGKSRNGVSRRAPRRTNSRLRLTNATSCHHQRVISKNPKQVVSDNADTDTEGDRNDDHTVREIVTVRTHSLGYEATELARALWVYRKQVPATAINKSLTTCQTTKATAWLTQSNHRQSIWVEQLELFLTVFRHGLRRRKKQRRYRLMEPRINYKKDAVDANKPEPCQPESATVYLFVRIIFEGVHATNPVSILCQSSQKVKTMHSRLQGLQDITRNKEPAFSTPTDRQLKRTPSFRGMYEATTARFDATVAKPSKARRRI
ncbi:hypothetical protein V8E54_007727 [Elaphomyces granulatus]